MTSEIRLRSDEPLVFHLDSGCDPALEVVETHRGVSVLRLRQDRRVERERWMGNLYYLLFLLRVRLPLTPACRPARVWHVLKFLDLTFDPSLIAALIHPNFEKLFRCFKRHEQQLLDRRGEDGPEAGLELCWHVAYEGDYLSPSVVCANLDLEVELFSDRFFRYPINLDPAFALEERNYRYCLPYTFERSFSLADVIFGITDTALPAEPIREPCTVCKRQGSLVLEPAAGPSGSSSSLNASSLARFVSWPREANLSLRSLLEWIFSSLEPVTIAQLYGPRFLDLQGCLEPHLRTPHEPSNLELSHFEFYPGAFFISRRDWEEFGSVARVTGKRCMVPAGPERFLVTLEAGMTAWGRWRYSEDETSRFLRCLIAFERAAVYLDHPTETSASLSFEELPCSLRHRSVERHPSRQGPAVAQVVELGCERRLTLLDIFWAAYDEMGHVAVDDAEKATALLRLMESRKTLTPLNIVDSHTGPFLP